MTTQAATFELEMTRFIRAPRDKVFEALTDEAAMAVWHCPRGMHMGEVSSDLRVGGRYHITMAGKDGSTHGASGTYQAIERPSFLAYTWAWDGAGDAAARTTLIEVTLTEKDHGTQLHMRHTGFPDAATRDDHNQGWTSVFNHLVDYLDPDGTAANVIVVGSPISPYVRAVRIALAEKGVAYTLKAVAPHTPDIDALHPFGRIPAMYDGPLEFYETRAILRYIDEAFDGPSLLPQSGVTSRARAEQWYSVMDDYGYDAIVKRFVLQYLFPASADKQPDRTIIDAALPDIDRVLATLDAAYGKRDYLVGNAPCMADYLAAPLLYSLSRMPEGPALLAKYPNVQRAQAVMQARPSFIAAEPDLAGKADATNVTPLRKASAA
ncbi:SRPBCC domain-containing protein [Dyella japonica]|uniref:glutathione transferase n=1 Tax=Dyella japonica A8 TaxID=1217721 RepID=A0A075JZQ5_9GAMM|nr:SRPBCC domain-containing protein [Dyella japonica]AIF47566.1 glutathione S-transferase [Dyella japonica A8]